MAKKAKITVGTIATRLGNDAYRLNANQVICQAATHNVQMMLASTPLTVEEINEKRNAALRTSRGQALGTPQWAAAWCIVNAFDKALRHLIRNTTASKDYELVEMPDPRMKGVPKGRPQMVGVGIRETPNEFVKKRR